jgi:hypothetical protein
MPSDAFDGLLGFNAQTHTHEQHTHTNTHKRTRTIIVVQVRHRRRIRDGDFDGEFGVFTSARRAVQRIPRPAWLLTNDDKDEVDDGWNRADDVERREKRSLLFADNDEL